MVQQNEEPGISRRTAICALSLIGVGVFTSAESAVAAGGVKVLANGKVEVTLKSNPALKKVGGVIRIDDLNAGSADAIERYLKKYL